jgi:hypothetical protein
MDDEALLKTMKNGLMIAGHEMGPVGDHWPALHAINGGLDQEFETMRRNEAVVGELEFNIADAIRQLEDASADFSPAMQERAKKFVKDMWEEYYAVFEPVTAANEPSIEQLLSESQMQQMRNTNAAAHIISRMGGRA